MNKVLRALILSLSVFPALSLAALINFSGPLTVIDEDSGLAVYSGVPTGTIFSGAIDDASANGSITDGTTLTVFGCCIAAGGLGLSNDVELSADDADFLNAAAGEVIFSPGEFVDGVDIEGDALTLTNGRIEVGLSYILNAGAFDDTDPGNYPFDPADLRLALYFIVEEDSVGTDIYSAVGRVQVVPVPAAIWLFGSALAWLGWRRRGG